MASEFFEQGDLEKEELKIQPIVSRQMVCLSILPVLQICFPDTTVLTVFGNHAFLIFILMKVSSLGRVSQSISCPLTPTPVIGESRPISF